MVTSRTETDSRVTGLVLAGGRSTRFGDAEANKAVAQLGTETLLGRVINVVATATGRPPVVAVRTPDQRETYADLPSDQNVSFMLDAPAFEGPLAGVYGGIDAIDTPWVFCCGCDMPLLSVDAIRWLVARLSAITDVDTLTLDGLAVRHSDGTADPLHALYRRSAIDCLRGQISQTAGPRALLASLDNLRVVPVATAPPGIPLEESMTNVNTQADLEAVSGHPMPER